jgi:hypothetical protein
VRQFHDEIPPLTKAPQAPGIYHNDLTIINAKLPVRGNGGMRKKRHSFLAEAPPVRSRAGFGRKERLCLKVIPGQGFEKKSVSKGNDTARQ